MLGEASEVDTVFDENRLLRLPAPEKFSGAADVKVFESHCTSMFRWLKIIGLGGPKHSERRHEIQSYYLTGAAKEWYESNVAGMGRLKRKWSHLEVILGLYDRFIDT
ncbi:hypothetical protein B0H15DRAFT_774278, partial [Mycena belliarum]